MAASVATIFLDSAPLIYSSQEIGRVNTLPFFSATTLDWSANPDFRRTYEELLGYYAQAEVARRGDIAFYPDEDVLCFTKTLGTEQLLVLVNLREQPIDLVLSQALRNSEWTDVLTGQPFRLDVSYTLPGHDYLLATN